MNANICDHKRPDRWIEVEREDAYTGEMYQDSERVQGDTFFEDISLGAMKCRQCGLVQYFTGQWRDFYERGIPCPGSERLTR